MLAEAGATWVITGHSERREARGETNADIASKSEAAHKAGINVILCVGETLAVRDAGKAEQVVADQLLASLPDDAAADWLAVAYEPIWAIGTGRIPTLEAVATMHAALRAALASRIGAEADKMRILYGGSMNGDNAADLMAIADVDGGLVGGASLSAKKFAPIIEAAEQRMAAAA
jgi:triosephosphate isomerase